MRAGFELDYLPRLGEKRDYGIGIVGAGFIVEGCHLPAYTGAGYRTVGITSRTGERARDLAGRFGIPKAYGSLDELLSDGEVEVVDVAVPPHAQPEVVRRVAEAGKHVLAQKPLATSYGEARETVEACEGAGVRLVVNQNGRYDPAIRAAKDLLEKGLVGRPVVATIELRFKPHWQPYQMEYERLMFLFMSIHHLDQFRFFFGTPDAIYASSRPHPSGEFKGEYLGAYILEYEDGPMATAWDDGFTWDEPGFGVFYRIEGTEGVVKMDIGWPRGGPSRISFYSKALGDVWFEPELEGSWFPGAFRYTMGELFREIETGEESPISGRNNLETMAMVEACYVSDREKRAVAISEIMGSR